MSIADLPLVTLLVSAVVLLVSTALLFHTLPAGVARSAWRLIAGVGARVAGRRRRRSRRVPERLAITGRPPALPPGPVATPVPPPGAPLRRRPAPPRQAETVPDAPVRAPGLQEAHATIERLLDRDPDRLALVIMQWIRDDDERRWRAP